jgi:integrase
MNAKLINFTSMKSVYRGKEILELYFVSGGAIARKFFFFDLFCQSLVDRNYSSNSIGDYLYRCVIFLDYIFEGFKVLGESAGSIKILFLHYGDYLRFGSSSSSSLVKQVSLHRPSPMISRNSALAYNSAVKALIDEAEVHVTRIRQYSDSGIEFIEQIDDEFVVQLSQLANLKVFGVKRKPVADFGLYGSSPKAKPSLTAHMGVKSALIIPPKFFPLEHINELIDCARCHRDAALWSLMAGVGSRESEADQIIFGDIDYGAGSVLLVNPSSRESTAYRGLSEREIKKLEWKGRDTPLTVFLEPYGERFFYHLEKYLSLEAKSYVGHKFVFQDENGRPLFLSDYSSAIYRPFLRAVKVVCDRHSLDGSGLAPHSLRHSYIYFMKNYVEHATGVGLDDFELMALTGHTSVEALRVYAVTDYQALLEKIYYANVSRRTRTLSSELELKIKFLEERLEDFRAQLKKRKSYDQ